MVYLYLIRITLGGFTPEWYIATPKFADFNLHANSFWSQMAKQPTVQEYVRFWYRIVSMFFKLFIHFFWGRSLPNVSAPEFGRFLLVLLFSNHSWRQRHGDNEHLDKSLPKNLLIQSLDVVEASLVEPYDPIAPSLPSLAPKPRGRWRWCCLKWWDVSIHRFRNWSTVLKAKKHWPRWDHEWVIRIPYLFAQWKETKNTQRIFFGIYKLTKQVYTCVSICGFDTALQQQKMFFL